MEKILPNLDFNKPQDFLDRMQQEFVELNERMQNLGKFTQSVLFNNLPNHKRDLLIAQLHAMATYASILQIRINIENTKRQMTAANH